MIFPSASLLTHAAWI